MSRAGSALRHLVLLATVLLALAACAPPAAPPAAGTPTDTATHGLPAPTTSPTPTQTPRPTATASPTATPTASPTPTPTHTASPTPTATPTPSPTSDPYAGLGILELAGRSFGEGALRVERTLATNEAFTRSLITYPSDGLTVYGFMNTPTGEGPFPVVIVLHGYVDPSRYTTLTYTTRYADALARAGFVAIHPNLRGFPPSDDGPDPFRIGMAADVMHLIAMIRGDGGQPGPLQAADPQRIGLWGHSMGGGISTRVMTIDPDIRAVVLYGAMSGDERRNYERIQMWSGGQRGAWELAAPDEALLRISPIHHLDRVAAAVSIHHGANDGTVPLAWSEDLCQRLQDLAKTVECFTYPGQPHTFTGDGDRLFIQRTIEFFERHLR
jgi:uncharacterized protein